MAVWILTGIALCAVGAYVAMLNWPGLSVSQEQVACTMEAMQCPDGSWVGRSGPTCEFVCPAATSSNSSLHVETRIDQGASALGVKIVPQEVLEDSRCAVDVQCIWAGRVRLSARVESDAQSTTTEFVLGEPRVVYGRTIILVDVLPPKKEATTPRANEYSFVFSVEE